MSAFTTVCASEFILLDHHPDLSRRPDARPGLIDAENRRAALTWNVFRTLELIAPSFWLRRFRARLDALTSLEAGGSSLSVRLWAVLPSPAERSRQEPIRVDALIETDTAVYGVMTMDGSDVELGDSTLARPDAILRVIDAVSWYAGARLLHRTRYVRLVGHSDRQRTDRALSRFPRRAGAPAASSTRRLGEPPRHRQDDVAGRCRHRPRCAESRSLSDLERFAASRTERWLHSLGIHPTD